jgi:hypothetical protein
MATHSMHAPFVRDNHGAVRLTALAMLLAVTVASPAVAHAQAAGSCPSGERPQFVFGFADLRVRLGDAMGDPATCAFPDPNGTGDVHQRTTHGLAFWRKSTNTPTFTNGSEHWALTSAGLVTWTGTSVDPPPADAAATPASSSSPVLLPPAGLAPFAGLPVSSIVAGATGYSVVYGVNGGSSAVVNGQPGRPTFVPVFSRCVNTALYCTENILGRDDTRPASEIFRGLTVKGQSAVATHTTCCNGLYWTVQWYDPAADMTYELSLEQDLSKPYGEEVSPGNLASARQLAALADQLVPAPAF